MIQAVLFDLDGTLLDWRQSLENYISDFSNISTTTQIISTIFIIYRLTDKK